MRDRYLFVLIGLLSLSLFSFFFQLFFLKKEAKSDESILTIKQEKVISQKLEEVSKGAETQNEITGLLEEIKKKEAEIKNLSGEIANLKDLTEKNALLKNREGQDRSFLEIKRREVKQRDEIEQKSLEIQRLQAEIDRISKEKEKVVFLQSEKGVSSEDYEKIQKERDEYLERTNKAKREFEKNKTEIEKLKKEMDADKIAVSQLKSQLQAKNEEKKTSSPKDIADDENREKALQEKILALQSEISVLTQKNLEFSVGTDRLLSEKRILDEERILAKEKKESLLTGNKELASQAIKETEGMFSALSDEERKEPEEMLLLAKSAYSKGNYNEAFEQAAKSAQKLYYTKVSKEEREKVRKAGLAGTLLNILLLWR
ncbi:MAG: hypothetical protein QME07_03725 [bacterium]|nr:hypothetical protein [bacterium]